MWEAYLNSTNKKSPGSDHYIKKSSKHGPSEAGDLVQAEDEGVDEHDGEGLEDHPADGRVSLKLLDVGDGQAEDQVHEDDGHVEHEQHEDDSRHPAFQD